MKLIEDEYYEEIEVIEDDVGDFFLPYSITILEKDNTYANPYE